MRILYLSQYFPPEFGAAASRAHSMSRWLARFGHEVTVVTAIPNYLLDAVPESYRGRRQESEDIDGVKVYRAWLYTSPKRDNWRRMANYLTFMLSAWRRGRQLFGSFDVVIVSSPPLFLGLTGVALARRFHIPLVFDVRDLWPEVGVKLGAFREGSAVERVWRSMADYTYRHASAIVPVTQGMYEDMVARGLPTEKLHLIRNGVDLAQIQNNAPPLREDLRLEGKYVVLYAGLIGIMQGVDVVVRAARILQSHPEIHFLIVGDGVKRDEVVALARSLNLQNVTLLPRQPLARIPRFLNTADVCLATLANSGLKGVIPYKMLEAWAYRRPIVVTDAEGESGKMAASCEAGIATPPGDAQTLAEAILTLKQDRALAKQMGENGRRCIEEKLNREKLALEMARVLKEVTGASVDARR